MDNSDQPAGTLLAAFSPNRLFAGGMLAVWIGFVVLWLTSGGDRQGKLIYGIAAVMLAALCATDLIWSPRLKVTAAGLTIHSPTLTATYTWSQIEAIRVDRRRRLGLSSATLEIDAGEQLAVLSRRALNADPQDVAEVIEAVRSPG